MADPTPSIWHLRSQDGRLIAALHAKSFDMPWMEGDVVKGPAWEDHSDLLAASMRAFERATGTDEWTEADRLYDQVRNATVLIGPGGAEVPEYLLHIDAMTATWRWHDEPFDHA